MDHRADLATPPWRSAAFIAATVATVEAVILIIVGIWLFGKFFSDEVSKATDPSTIAREAVERELAPEFSGKSDSARDGKPILTRAKTSVLVLNGNGVTGAALEAANKVRERNYLISATGNAAHTDYPRSIIMFRPGFEQEAQRLAKDVHVRRVVPLDGMRPGTLQGAHVAFIIGGQ
ncbi:MAG: LytR C-terminal domain-containing protein [Solirubrobacterales bacterium]